MPGPDADGLQHYRRAEKGFSVAGNHSRGVCAGHSGADPSKPREPSALSVLTEEEFFLGSLAHLKEAKKAVGIPILRKDFIFDPWQVWEARAAGADTFLLIAAILGDAALRDLLELGRSLQMEPLVEVHSRAELDGAIAAGAKVIGVNNRDLRDFSVRLETSLELIESIPEELHRGQRIGIARAGRSWCVCVRPALTHF